MFTTTIVRLFKADGMIIYYLKRVKIFYRPHLRDTLGIINSKQISIFKARKCTFTEVLKSSKAI